MSPLIPVFIILIAFCTLVQALFFGALAVAAWKAKSRLGPLQVRAERELPRLAQRVDAVARRASELSGKARRTVALPLVPVLKIRALGRAVGRAVATYRQPALSRP